MVSIRDVAKEAGVAISTVSKVLNNYPNVSEATKKKVMEAAFKEIKPESRLMEDLKADSANIMVMIMDMEDRFGITVEDDQIMKLKTVGDVVNYIEKIMK